MRINQVCLFDQKIIMKIVHGEKWPYSRFRTELDGKHLKAQWIIEIHTVKLKPLHITKWISIEQNPVINPQYISLIKTHYCLWLFSIHMHKMLNGTLLFWYQDKILSLNTTHKTYSSGPNNHVHTCFLPMCFFTL